MKERGTKLTKIEYHKFVDISIIIVIYQLNLNSVAILFFLVPDGCQPGSWSPNGTPECSLCAVGSYSDVYGAAECKSCPGSQSTVEEGATNFSQCQGEGTYI